MIDELSKTLTTQEVVSYYRKKYSKYYQGYLAEDMLHCSKGNKLAIEACLGNEWRMYQREHPERPLDENTDIIGEMRGGN